jgi:hypothetical protein
MLASHGACALCEDVSLGRAASDLVDRRFDQLPRF